MHVNPELCYVNTNTNKAEGIRILLTLPNTVKVSEGSVGTKTITSRGVDYTYNVWNIE